MQVIDRAFVRGLMPARDPGGHKGTFGKVYLLGGSVGYTGAPVLCAGGAVHSGCGLVFLGVPETVWPIAAARCLCAMPHPLAEQDGRLSAAAETEIRHRAAVCDAVAVGCGLGRSEGSDALVRALLTLEKPLVLDADGINALAGHIDTLSCRRGCVTVLTPHDGELARIGGDMTAPREAAAAAFASCGMQDTTVEVRCRPGLALNTHRVELEGDFGHAVIEVASRPSADNPRSSALAADSVVACLQNLDAGIVF